MDPYALCSLRLHWGYLLESLSHFDMTAAHSGMVLAAGTK